MLAHNLGLELPVYDESTPIAWKRSDVQIAAQADEPSFVRRAVLASKREANLAVALRIADELLDEASETLDVRTTPHQWGLYKGMTPRPDLTNYDSSRHPLIPAGYSLVAEVDIVRPAIQPNIATQLQLAWRIGTYKRRKLGKLMIGDIKSEQIVFQNRGEGAVQGWLVDIEPRIREPQSTRWWRA